MTLSVPLYTYKGGQIVCISYPTHYILTPYTHASVYILLHENIRVNRVPESLCIAASHRMYILRPKSFFDTGFRPRLHSLA